MSLPIAVIGYGRMGRAVAELAPAAGAEVRAVLDARAAITQSSLAGAAVAIEFTTAGAVAANVRACVDAGCAVVVGTTGWQADRPVVEQYVRECGGALLSSPNFSLGVHALRQVVALAARLARDLPAVDLHLVETHHTAKRDAPSGTALLLQETVEHEVGHDVPVSSIRVGSVPGTHELVIDGRFEQIRIIHETRDRRVFAEGALFAARWLAGRGGVFTLDDALSTVPPDSP